MMFMYTVIDDDIVCVKDVNAVDKNGWSVVHAAAFHGRLGCLQLIIRWGGPMDDTDNQGNTPGMNPLMGIN